MRMNVKRLLILFLLVSCLITANTTAQTKSEAAAPRSKPHIVVLATGGTIASPRSPSGAHESSPLGVQQILDALPQLKNIAEVTGEDVVSINSADMSDETWLKLARRLNAVLSRPDVDGVVITHGTDTLEETAYFLHLVMKNEKPVVMTGAMRNFGSLGADGPANLFNSVEVAINPQAKDRGVMVVMNDQIFSARDVTKQNSMRPDAFQSPNRGPEGFVAEGHVVFFGKPAGRYGLKSELAIENATGFPPVEVFYGYANMGRAAIDNAVQRGVKGIVIAAAGNGDLSHATTEGLAEAAKKGVAVVRSSRVISGFVAPNLEADDDALGFVASLELNPQKSRILLMLALAKTSNPKELQQFFYQY